jgi:hypothetical protein
MIVLSATNAIRSLKPLFGPFANGVTLARQSNCDCGTSDKNGQFPILESICAFPTVNTKPREKE